MNTEAHQYIRIRHVMTTDPDHLEFQERLKSSPINNNRYYLGLLLMTIVSVPASKIQYIRTLLKFGADINFTQPSSMLESESSGKSVLMIACEKSVAANVKYLLSFENLQVGNQDCCGEHALHYAVRNPDENEAVKLFEYILKDFPHMVASQVVGRKSVLFLAIDYCKMKIIQFLVRNYVDPNQQTEPAGITPLHYTISLNGQMDDKNLQQILLLLLRFKADPKKKNYLSQDSYDYADKYLFDLENVAKLASECEQMEGIQQQRNKCFTLNTYADSKTAFSKEDDYSRQSQIEEGRMLQLEQQQIEDSKISLKKDEGNVIEERVYLPDDYEEIHQKSKDPTIKTRYKQKQKIIYYQQQSQEEQPQFQPQLTIQKFHENFSQQIWAHCLKCQQEYQLAMKDIEQLWKFLLHTGNKLELVLNTIGSFATGLWTHFSDIDLVFINEKANFVNINNLLEKVHHNLQQNAKKLRISELYLNLETKFPNIKLKLNEVKNERRVEIGIFQRKCSGRKYVQFITQHLQNNPLIAPVFFVMHKILSTFNLHRPTKNGIKTYTLFLMILLSMQTFPSQTLSQALISLIYYYNNCYPYQYQYDTNQNRKVFLSIIDPLNSENNTGGRETDTQKLILMFRVLHYAITKAYSDRKSKDLLEYLFEIHQMFI